MPGRGVCLQALVQLHMSDRLVSYPHCPPDPAGHLFTWKLVWTHPSDTDLEPWATSIPRRTQKHSLSQVRGTELPARKILRTCFTFPDGVAISPGVPTIPLRWDLKFTNRLGPVTVLPNLPFTFKHSWNFPQLASLVQAEVQVLPRRSLLGCRTGRWERVRRGCRN